MFDLDQTLAESKQALTEAMGELVAKLLAKTRVAVISGGALPQFLKQVVDKLPPDAKLSNLYLLPTSGAALYEWRGGTWQNVYDEKLTPEEGRDVVSALRAVLKESGLVDLTAKSWGERIENRGSQVTFSALGQEAPLEAKRVWDPDKTKRRALQAALAARLPAFRVGMGGATSIDITKRGIDKAYGIRQLAAHLQTPIEEILYVGDQLVPGGNDEAALTTRARVHAVENPTDTAFFITSLLTGS